MIKSFSSLFKSSLHLPKYSFSLWKDVPKAPDDPILGLVDVFRKDPASKKVSLVVGAYRDDNGKPWVLDCVRKIRIWIWSTCQLRDIQD